MLSEYFFSNENLLPSGPDLLLNDLGDRVKFPTAGTWCLLLSVVIH